MIQASDKGRFPQRTLRRAKPAPAKSMVEDAEALIDAKRQYEALGLLRNVPLGHPDIKKATSLRIRAYCETGQMERAEDVFSFASENRVLAQEGCTTLFLAYAEKDPASAECAFARALESEVPRNLVYNAMIYVSVQCGNYVRANSLLLEAEREGAADCHIDRIVKANPNQADTLLELGVLDLLQKRFKEAEEPFRRAYSVDPSNVRGLLGLAEIHFQQQEPDKAVQVIADEVKKQPQRTDLKKELANAEMRARQSDKSIADYQAIIDWYKDSPAEQAEIYYRIGTTYHFLGQNEKAIESMHIWGLVARGGRAAQEKGR